MPFLVSIEAKQGGLGGLCRGSSQGEKPGGLGGHAVV